MRRMTPRQLWRRLDRLAQLCPKPLAAGAEEARRAWLVANGYDPSWHVLGLEGGRGVLVLPPKDPDH